MCSNYKCVGLRVPESKKTIFYLVVKCSELSNLRTLQLGENDRVTLATLYAVNYFVNLVTSRLRQTLNNIASSRYNTLGLFFVMPILF
jgi:hypothetical protein